MTLFFYLILMAIIFSLFLSADNKQTDRILVLTRGVPGSGKTSFCLDMAGEDDEVIAADDFFYDDKGEYKFDPKKLGAAHKQCQDRCHHAMVEGKRVFVNNTMVNDRDMKDYFDLAKEYDYKVYVVVLENRHGGKDVHGVPEHKLQEMEKKLKNNIKLR